MRLLADESVDMAVVRALRRDQHDVRAVTEDRPGISDFEVMDLAVAEERVLITEDRDFGRLFHARGADLPVLYRRYPAGVRAQFAEDVAAFIRRSGESLGRAFVVMQPGRVRIGRLPS